MKEKLEDGDAKSRLGNVHLIKRNRRFPREDRRVLRLKGPVDGGIQDLRRAFPPSYILVTFPNSIA